MTEIKKFTIFGERCTGTNFLEQAILENFDVELTWELGLKHFFGHREFTREETQDILILGIVRDPWHWINSFYRNPWHLNSGMKKFPKDNFLNSEFWSFRGYDNIKPEAQESLEILEDRNWTNPDRRYRNVIEARNLKNRYLLDHINYNVANYSLIRYEDLCQEYFLILESLRKGFNLKKKHDSYKPIGYYKDMKDVDYVARDESSYEFSKSDIYFHPNFDVTIEKRLKYV